MLEKLQTAKASAIFALILASFPAWSLPRSAQAIAEFKRQQPCPITEKRRGPCPGYQIDHVTPLKCGGPDHPSNMQWLTVEDHKAKTKREARLCRRPK